MPQRLTLSWKTAAQLGAAAAGCALVVTAMLRERQRQAHSGSSLYPNEHQDTEALYVQGLRAYRDTVDACGVFFSECLKTTWAAQDDAFKQAVTDLVTGLQSFAYTPLMTAHTPKYAGQRLWVVHAFKRHLGARPEEFEAPERAAGYLITSRVTGLLRILHDPARWTVEAVEELRDSTRQHALSALREGNPKRFPANAAD